jgi:hypothetical protein
MTESVHPISVLAIGHCGPDSWMLRGTVERALGPGVRFDSFDDETRLRAHLESADTPVLLLVNRRLDGWFESADGIALIGSVLQSERRDIGAMLISNLPEALAEAESAGAMPGFGKTALHAAETADALRAAAGRLHSTDHA